jgi:hypothetical protein
LARRSLKPQLNQIRTWVRQGRTDAWIAHQLEVTPKDIQAFKRDRDLAPDEEADGDVAVVLDDERDMRAEDEALVAAELDALSEAEEAADSDESDDSGDSAGSDEEADRPARRRGRRGGRRRRGGRGRRRDLEGTLDHGKEGYGLWLDPAVEDDAVYAEHWKGHRPVTVVVEPDRIVIRRSGEDTDDGADPGD